MLVTNIHVDSKQHKIILKNINLQNILYVRMSIVLDLITSLELKERKNSFKISEMITTKKLMYKLYVSIQSRYRNTKIDW